MLMGFLILLILAMLLCFAPSKICRYFFFFFLSFFFIFHVKQMSFLTCFFLSWLLLLLSFVCLLSFIWSMINYFYSRFSFFIENHFLGDLKCNYSKRPKTERSVFGAFIYRSVVESFGFQTTSENRTISFGYRTFGSILYLQPNVRFIFQR